MDYYDIVLVGIFTSLCLGFLGSFFTGLPLKLGLGIGSVPSLSFMYYGMFMNAPTRE